MQSPIRVLELRSVRGTGGGPEKTILLGAARSDPAKYAITVCYIRDRRDREFGPRTKAVELPIDYLEVLERNSWDPTILSKIRRVIREKCINIIHAHDYKTNLLALLLAHNKQIIPLSTAHGWTGHSQREQFYYWADKKILRRFPRIIAVSSQIRDELIRNGVPKSRVSVILNGIESQSFKRNPDPDKCKEARQILGLPSNSIIIGSVGRLEPQKNYDLLLQAFCDLCNRHNNIFLAISGHGSLRSHLESKAVELKLDGRCKFLGHQQDVALVHHAFDIFIQSSDYEGTANAVLEAMALETPTIATDVGGTAEMIRDRIDGLIIPPKDKPALCSAIEEVLDNREAAITRAKAGRAQVEGDLSFRSRMRKLEAVYTELMNSVSGTHDPRC